MTTAHAMLPAADFDEQAEQLFVLDLKRYVARELEPFLASVADRLAAETSFDDQAATAYQKLRALPAFGGYLSLRRASQDLLWTVVQESVGRQRERLDQLAEVTADAPGSLQLSPDMNQPAYLSDADIHLMPGGYTGDPGGVAQGAVMDRGGAIYMLGSNGGLLNDGRGWTLASHLVARWPDLAPERILELGCGIGASAVPVALAFPEAEVHALDVGASMLRYARARAAHLGAPIHFRQGDAEHAPYPDGSFDCVFSCAVLHETSPSATHAIMRECLRLLRPSGVVAHLEVPQCYETSSLWTRIRGEIERDYNNEPNWKHATSADYAALLSDVGFVDVGVGYQDAVGEMVRHNAGFSTNSKGVFRSWFVASARKPGT